jgi:hypothetical protein
MFIECNNSNISDKDAFFNVNSYEELMTAFNNNIGCIRINKSFDIFLNVLIPNGTIILVPDGIALSMYNNVYIKGEDLSIIVGQENITFYISNEIGLEAFSSTVNDGFNYVNGVLEENITMTAPSGSDSNFIAIGNEKYPFSGSFDGNNKINMEYKLINLILIIRVYSHEFIVVKLKM